MFKLSSLVLAAALALPVSQAKAEDISAMSWPQIVAQAKKEGQVTWFNWFFQPRFREQVKAFEAKYGIKVTIPDGTDPNANLSKMLAEKGRAKGDIDVLAMPGDSVNQFKVADYLIGPLNKLLPGGGDLRYDINGGHSKGYAVAYWGNQTGLAYNPTLISKADLPHTVAEFKAYMEKHPDQLGLNTMNGGSGPGFITSIVQAIVPGVDYAADKDNPAVMAKLQPAWNWFDALKGKFVITASNADSITRLNSGEFAIVPTWEDFLSGLQHNGEVAKNIGFYLPDFGMPGGGNVVAIPKNAPHPAAAILFIDWLVSPKTQTTFNQVFGSAPQNPKANSSKALISMAERKAKSRNWIPDPLKTSIVNAFVNKVAMN